MKSRAALSPSLASTLLSIAGCAALASGALGCGGGQNTSSTGSGGSTTTGTTSTGGTGGSTVDPDEFAAVQKSCVYQCPPDNCPEANAPYACQNLKPWAEVPHADSCDKWDGTFPTPQKGQCSASEPSGDAVKYAGADPDDPKSLILPGGRRLTPAGADIVFPDPNTMTSNLALVPGTTLVLTVDDGNGDHIVRAVDASKIGISNPVLSQVNFAPPESLNQGIAFSPPDRVYVASAQGVVQALSLDVATGALKRDDARSVALPASPASPGGTFWVSGVAVSNDQKLLFASGAKDTRLVISDITAGGADYGKKLAEVDLGNRESYGIYVDPADPTTHFVYVTMWANKQVLEVDVSNPAAAKISRTFQVDKDPEGLAFLDAKWMVVGNDLGDTLSVIDRTSGAVTSLPVEPSVSLRGIEPSSLVYDAKTKRLYATLAGIDAIGAYDVDLSKSPPSIVPAGRLPTQWWPSGVAVLPDGSLAVTSLWARGVGPKTPDQEYDLLRGGIQHIPAPAQADLTKGDAAVTANVDVASRSGHSVVQCPPGADDFPIPSTNTGKPSSLIDHVFIVVRENKSFDALFGDFSGVKGDPKNLMVPPDQMDGIWANIRKLAKTFAHGDNFYTTAFLSNQGHLWATHGRTDDFNEREWPVTGYGRGLRGDPDSGGVTDVSRPDEGSLFDWLGKNKVPYDILGEIVGIPAKPPEIHTPTDPSYPGGLIQSIGYPDIEKACYIAGRARVRCDLGNVVYLTFPNDHTRGVSPSAPRPEVMFAVNDEATGMLVDALSHSAIWPRTLVVVLEDDPAQGGESVDYHRTIAVMASPWVKRGYVSHAQADVPSVHKLLAHIFAIPYANKHVEDAALPLDMFTSTPDYTPYTYVPRSYPLGCGKAASGAEKRLTDSWDWREPDEQPGLDAQVRRWLSGKQLTELTPAMEGEIERRLEARKREAEMEGEGELPSSD
jgi:hypothetical protein